MASSNEVPPTTFDPDTGVRSRLTVISSDTGVSARVYLPNLSSSGNPRSGHHLLPVLVYFHGGGFCSGTASTPVFHNYITSLIHKSHVLAVSVDYRLAPAHPIPAAYDDSWLALQWVASHAAGDAGVSTTDGWLAAHGDLGRGVILVGESAGGNIVHHMALRAGSEPIHYGVTIRGAVLLHPYFLGAERSESEAADPEATATLERMWTMVCPSSSAAGGGGFDDHRINPMARGAPSLWWLGCRRVLVCVAGKDVLRDRGRAYYHALRGSGWGGEVEMVESEGEGHVFHLFNRMGQNAVALDTAITRFLNL